jgi:hypothetical protein
MTKENKERRESPSCQPEAEGSLPDPSDGEGAKALSSEAEGTEPKTRAFEAEQLLQVRERRMGSRCLRCA